MKKFLAISLTLLIVSIQASACSGEITHNYYMMNLYPRWQWEQDNQKRYNKFWEAYTGGEVTYFSTWAKENLLEIIRKKNDAEMENYVTLLCDYLDNCGEISNGWDYPTAEELNRQDETMETILACANEYVGSRLRPQFALLKMRAQMQLERHQDNITFWNDYGKDFPASVYRDMMENIYAGALLRTGQRMEAWNIYARQQDFVSLRWSVFKYRNLAGIRTIYEQYPNAEVLNYLVQDFVNNAQETFDNVSAVSSNVDSQEQLIEWVNDNVNMVGCNPIYSEEVKNFINFAYQVVNEKKNPNPCLWMTAAGLLHHFLGDSQQGLKELDQALKLNGNARTKDNARAIRLLIAASVSPANKKFSQYIVKELKWLDDKNREGGEYDDYFAHAKDRIVNIALASRYERDGNLNMATALRGMGVGSDDSFRWYNSDSDEYTWNGKYSGEFYYNTFMQMKADEMKSFFDFLRAPHKDELEKMVVEKNRSIYNDDYLNDLIGTKLLSEGRFADAETYLEQVPLSFIEGQNISWYMAHRDYTQPRWLVSQDADDEDTDGPNKATIAVNKKLEFCREMKQLMARHLLAATGDQRKQLAYDMAVRFYQASPWGQCWCLSDYGFSTYHDYTEPLPLFVQNAVTYLTEAKTANDSELRLQSYFALAYIPQDEWITYDWSSGEFTPNRESIQYAAIRDLAQYVKQNPQTQKKPYIQKCDLIRQFMK